MTLDMLRRVGGGFGIYASERRNVVPSYTASSGGDKVSSPISVSDILPTGSQVISKGNFFICSARLGYYRTLSIVLQCRYNIQYITLAVQKKSLIILSIHSHYNYKLL